MMRVGTNETELIAILREVVSLIGEGRVEDAADCLFVVDKEKVCSLIRLGVATGGTYDPTFADDPEWSLWPYLRPITKQTERIFYQATEVILDNDPTKVEIKPSGVSGISNPLFEDHLYAGFANTYLMTDADPGLTIEFWIRKVPGGLALEFDIVTM
jgi:hypothetical protein